MKKAALLLVSGFALASYGTQATAQQENPQKQQGTSGAWEEPSWRQQDTLAKKIRIVLDEGEGQAVVYEYNSIEEMRADARLKGKKLPLLFKDGRSFRLDGDAGEPQTKGFRMEADSAMEEFVLMKLEYPAGAVDDDQVMLFLERKRGTTASGGDGEAAGNILMHQFLRRKEVPERAKALLLEHGIKIEQGQQVVVYQRVDEFPEPPLPPVPPAPPVAEPAPEPAPGVEAIAAPAVEMPDWLEEVTLYPNPSDGKFQLRFKSTISGPVTLRLLDLNGKLIYQERISQAAELVEKTISLPAGTKGLHLLQLEQEGRKFSERVLLR